MEWTEDANRVQRTITDHDGQPWKVERRLTGGVGARRRGTGLPLPASWLLVFASSRGVELGVPAAYDAIDVLSIDQLRVLLGDVRKRVA